MPKSASRPESGAEVVRTARPPARTRERRAQQLVLQAENLIERRLADGTASPTEVVAILRLGTELERVNIERIKMHTEYLAAQRDKAKSESVREELFENAMAALTTYQGKDQ